MDLQWESAPPGCLCAVFMTRLERALEATFSGLLRARGHPCGPRRPHISVPQPLGSLSRVRLMEGEAQRLVKRRRVFPAVSTIARRRPLAPALHRTLSVHALLPSRAKLWREARKRSCPSDVVDRTFQKLAGRKNRRVSTTAGCPALLLGHRWAELTDRAGQVRVQRRRQ